MVALSADEREFLAGALLLRRYLGHAIRKGVEVMPGSEARAHVALHLAKRLGLFKEYWDVMQSTDVLSISVKNLDAPRKRGPYGKRRRPRL